MSLRSVTTRNGRINAYNFVILANQPKTAVLTARAWLPAAIPQKIIKLCTHSKDDKGVRKP
jgi:hypothetical protein